MTHGLRKLVFFILLLGVAYVAYQYMIKPANKHLAEQKVRLHTKLAKLDEFEKATAAAEDLTKQLEELQKRNRQGASRRNRNCSKPGVKVQKSFKIKDKR